MLRLYILRHAKTGMALPGQRDFDRRLNPRGEEDLGIIRELITERRLFPAHVYCSPAQRTRQTLSGISPAFDRDPGVSFPEVFYHGSVEDYLQVLRRHPVAEPLMIVGHNPMCEALANMLAASGDSNALHALWMKYPTGAMAVLDIPADEWSQLREGTATLRDFLCPKDFREAD